MKRAEVGERAGLERSSEGPGRHRVGGQAASQAERVARKATRAAVEVAVAAGGTEAFLQQSRAQLPSQAADLLEKYLWRRAVAPGPSAGFASESLEVSAFMSAALSPFLLTFQGG